MKSRKAIVDKLACIMIKESWRFGDRLNLEDCYIVAQSMVDELVEEGILEAQSSPDAQSIPQ